MRTRGIKSPNGPGPRLNKRFVPGTGEAVVSFTLLTPKSPGEAFSLLSEGPPGESMVLAGGTDLLIDIEEGRLRPKRVISLRKLPWRTLRWSGSKLTIGSLLPLAEIEADADVRERLPGFFHAVRAVGSLALRHRATLGGNIGRSAPASDLLPILLALDAVADLEGPLGKRSIPLDRLLDRPRALATIPGELVAAVTIPVAAPCEYVWQRVRPANDISQLGVAVAAPGERTGWRVALGGIVPRPIRLPETERCLVNARPTDAEVELAAQEASQKAPIATDKRASEAYRRRLVGTLVRLALRATIDQLPPPARRGNGTPRRRT